MQLKRGRWRRERSDQRREAGLAPCPLPSFLAASARAGGSSSSSPSTSPTATRGSPTRALKQFFGWTEAQRVGLDDIEPVTVAAYVEQLGTEAAKPTVKQHLAAIRQLFDYLVTGGILPSNPVGSVRGPKYVVKRGKTPVLSAEEARQMLDSIESDTLIGLRDRALIGVMVYSLARVSAAMTMRVEDYFQQGKRAWLRLHEKGSKRHEVPCHHKLEECLDAWIDAAGIASDKKGPLFRAIRKGDKLTRNPMDRADVLRMIKRRAAGAGLPYSTCCHTFRATG